MLYPHPVQAGIIGHLNLLIVLNPHILGDLFVHEQRRDPSSQLKKQRIRDPDGMNRLPAMSACLTAMALLGCCVAFRFFTRRDERDEWGLDGLESGGSSNE